MYTDETPRSVGYGTPRDDRFYTPRGAHDFKNSSSEGDYGTPRDYKEIRERRDSRDTYDHGYKVPNPHNYWNNLAHNNYQEDDFEDEDAFGVMAGVSEKDVEDIFSYARHGRVEAIEKLLDRGIPINVRDMYGNTLLVIACQNGNKRIAKSVLRRGADINARNHKGNTPLHYCYTYGYGDTLGQYLIKKGADPSLRNNAGRPVMEGI